MIVIHQKHKAYFGIDGKGLNFGSACGKEHHSFVSPATAEPWQGFKNRQKKFKAKMDGSSGTEPADKS